MACLTNPNSQPSLDISPIWIPLSALRLPNHRENRYDVTNYSWVSIMFYSRVFSFYSTYGASGRLKMVSPILHLILFIGFHEICLLAMFVAKHVHLRFYRSFRSVHALSQFVLHIFVLFPFDIPLPQVFV
jgi:hypothetical protein